MTGAYAELATAVGFPAYLPSTGKSRDPLEGVVVGGGK